ncbi:hypothetical protein V4Y02_24250, partial [Escherichia coli]
ITSFLKLGSLGKKMTYRFTHRGFPVGILKSKFSGSELRLQDRNMWELRELPEHGFTWLRVRPVH